MLRCKRRSSQKCLSPMTDDFFSSSGLVSGLPTAMLGWAAPGFSKFANAHAAFWTLPLVSGLWTLARALAHRHAVGCGFIFLVEVGVHEEGEQGGEAVEGGVGEVLLFLRRS